MEKESIDFYVSNINEMLKQADAENNMSLLSILHTLKAGFLSDDIRLLSYYVNEYTKEKLKYQQN